MGSITNPAVREADETLFIQEFKQIVYIYKNDGLEQFLSLLKEHFEPILFTTGHLLFAQKVLEALNAKEVFRHVLHQDNCSLFQKDDEDIYEYVKQIDKYMGEERSPSRAVLIDSNEFNCIFNPDNVIYTQGFNADHYQESSNLNFVTHYLEQIYNHVLEGGDVRTFIANEFNIRKTLEKSKLL